MEDRRWKMEDGRPKMEDGRWKMEDGRWKMEDRRWKMEDGRWKMEDGEAARASTARCTDIPACARVTTAYFQWYRPCPGYGIRSSIFHLRSSGPDAQSRSPHRK